MHNHRLLHHLIVIKRIFHGSVGATCTVCNSAQSFKTRVLGT